MLVLIGSFSFEAEKSELKNCSSELVCFDVKILKNLVFFNNKHLPQKAGIPPEGGGGGVGGRWGTGLNSHVIKCYL